MREVAQVCRRCGRRSFVAVDPWADRPDLTGYIVCDDCLAGARGRGYEREFAPWLFAVLVVIAVVAGVAQAAS